MNGYELVIPYLIADRQARADAERLARLVSKKVQDEDPRRIDGEGLDFLPEPWVPVILRGYPYDPEFGR